MPPVPSVPRHPPFSGPGVVPPTRPRLPIQPHTLAPASSHPPLPRPPDPNARPDIPAIQAHPWYRVDLNPAALSFNDTLVADSLANATPDSVYEDIRSIVRDAQQVVRGKPQHAGKEGRRGPYI